MHWGVLGIFQGLQEHSRSLQAVSAGRFIEYNGHSVGFQADSVSGSSMASWRSMRIHEILEAFQRFHGTLKRFKCCSSVFQGASRSFSGIPEGFRML